MYAIRSYYASASKKAEAAPKAAPAASAAKPARSPNAPTEETVLTVKHYTDRMFAFRMTRPAAFRFRSGEFVMIGLPNEET